MIWGYVGLALAGITITIVIEIAIASLFRFNSPNEFKTVALASLITYPVLHLLISIGFTISLTYYNISIFVLLLEIIVVGVEFFILYYVFKSKYSWKYLLLLAFTMNAASYIFGLLVF